MGDLGGLIETHKLKLPWRISEKEFQKFKELNSSFNPKYINHHCIEVPEETSIDLSPLLPLLPIHISNNSPTFAKSIPELIKFNDNLNIETLNSSLINIKTMADLPTRQNGELSRQLSNWTVENGLIGLNDSSSKFHLVGPNTDGKFGPDAAYFPLQQHMNIDIETRKNNTIPIAPSFVIENRSYSPRPNNERQYQMDKMCMWIECGSESGLLIDGKSRMVDLYCRTNQLHPQVGQPNLYVHPQAQLQIQQTQQQIAQLQNRILGSQQSLLINPGLVGTEGHQDILNSIQTKQDQLNILINFNHIYFDSMRVVPNHPGVFHVSVPFWPPNQIIALPQHGPNLIIHCIGDVNGFKLDLSSYPMD
ncbi:hypothetical protein DLAC_04803 [Tieghemostelium lacteum]|uniref:Putative restriction endonuclease domain-containing protein n=1 Tax=Tieghemostelium lacteum TaxID=361077 RepID=A0A151ZKQ8_TIELA|nr:hypothetical protein DLAC_04803 [Tieghemostelium lacteum]|eukprot:KYQ94497.1 hypothetical protein DLAC_04803 [Tieghemostelium lacteum]